MYGCTQAVLGVSRICQPFLAPYVAMKSQSIRKDTVGSFLMFSCHQILCLLQWSSVADDPSVPLLPRAQAASKTNQAKRISSSPPPGSEDGETARGSSIFLALA